MLEMQDVRGWERDETVSHKRGLYGVEDRVEVGNGETVAFENSFSCTRSVERVHVSPPPIPSLRWLSTPPPTASIIAPEIRQRRLSSLPPTWRQLRTPPPDKDGRYSQSESPGSSPSNTASFERPASSAGISRSPHSVLGKHPRSPSPPLPDASACFERQIGTTTTSSSSMPFYHPPLWTPSLPPPPPTYTPSFLPPLESWTTAHQFALSQLTPRCVPDLQAALRSRNLPILGLREDLMTRLADDMASEWTHCQRPPEVVLAPGEIVWLNARRVPELKEMCRVRGLPVGGLKKDLMFRLAEALREEEEERRGRVGGGMVRL
ncbi:hypothetical protein K440DRAFT_669727 [Wilcoxina mikolae CBS 423.85]|nr:hypothetical protein K440DRAFT_669727 [Wilcoxina mikolae CBS 423.85]